MRFLSSRRNPVKNNAGLGRSAAMLLWIAAGCVPVVLTPAVTFAQAVETVTPYYAVVTREGTSLQCRLGSASYPVKSLSASQLLRITGQSGSWLQVEYPAGMSAFVKLDDASLIEGGKAVKLSRNSRLMAANADGGVNWWYLLDKDLPAGTTFSVTKTVKGSDGKDTGYLVPAPKGAYGFVRKDAVRQATQSEIDAAGKGEATPTPPPPVKPEVKPEVKPPAPPPAEQPVPAPANPPVNPPANPPVVTPAPAGTPAVPANPANTPPANTPPANPPASDPNAAPTAPAPANPPVGTPPDATVTPPANPDPTAPVTVTPPAAPAKPKVDPEEMAALYQFAMNQREGETEITAIIGQFQKAITQLEETPGSERMRRQLTSRLDALKLRSELLETLKQSDARLSNLKRQSETMNEQLSKLERERQFAVVGRLLASSVYDGRKLPLMYRVTSADTTAARTLAYVIPTQTIILADKLGTMVGVAGDKKYDEDLKVNVITPTRIESITIPVIEPAPATPAPAPSGNAPSTPTPDGLRTEVPIKPAPAKDQ